MIFIIRKSINIIFLFFSNWGYMSLFTTFKTFDFFLWFCFRSIVLFFYSLYIFYISWLGFSYIIAGIMRRR